MELTSQTNPESQPDNSPKPHILEAGLGLSEEELESIKNHLRMTAAGLRAEHASRRFGSVGPGLGGKTYPLNSMA